MDTDYDTFRASHYDNFRAWYADILVKLYPYRDAGFAILMIAFPLLERYLRHTARLAPQAPLTDAFFDALLSVYPELGDGPTARQFWQVYRNGLLHEVTLSLHDRGRKQMPLGSLSHDIPGLTRTAENGFSLNPVDFSERIIQTIDSNFTVFEGDDLAAQLPTVNEYEPGIERTEPLVLSTNVNRPRGRLNGRGDS